MKALYFNKFGDSSVLQYGEVERPIVQENEVLVKTYSIGVNFADIYRRKGNYHLVGDPPYILGYEAAGVVEQVGSSVEGINVGDRVAFADSPFANAEFVTVDQTKIIPLPDKISFDVAASILLQGLTAHYLIRDSYQIKKGDTVVVHAAAGGVGQLLVQLIKMMGGKVIGLTSSTQKAEAAKRNGADAVFLYSSNWVESVIDFTDSNGADVVYESVGSTLEQSFEATKTGGTVVFFGMAGGDPVLIDPRMLMDTSKTLTGGDLWNVLLNKDERIRRSHELFNWIIAGKLTLQAPTVFPLKDGAKAHDWLESRKSTGKLLLKP